VTQSCQFAIPLGKLAGHNAVAGLVGERLLEFSPPSYVTCLDLGDAGAVFSTGWDRRVALVGERGKQRKRQILSWIEPPLDDPAELLRRADFTTSVEVTDRLLA
jgi:NADH dehydrogenase